MLRAIITTEGGQPDRLTPHITVAQVLVHATSALRAAAQEAAAKKKKKKKKKKHKDIDSLKWKPCARLPNCLKCGFSCLSM